MKNPFQYGAELRAGQLVNRKGEIREVVRAIEDHERLFLIGPRRHGKTAVLNAAVREARRAGALIVFIDAEACAGVDDLVRRLVAQAAMLLESGVERAAEKVLKFFARLRPRITFDANTGEPSVGLGVEAPSDATPLLVDALDGFARLARDVRAPVALLIDEFQKVIEWGGKDTEGQLRAAMQRHKEIAFVVAGSKTALLNDMTLNPERPFYRLGKRLFLGPLPREEFRPFITRGFEAAGFKVERPATEAILDLAEDVPYNVQALASCAWELMRDRDERTLTPGLVEEASRLLVARDASFYVTLWNTLTEVQKRLLRAVIAAHGRGLASAAASATHHLPTSTVSKTLRLLEERSILRREEAGREIRWRFEDPFFALWLRR